MTLGQKLGKLFNTAAWRSAGRALYRWSHPVSLSDLKRGIDFDRLNEIRERHGVPGDKTNYPKYLDLDRFLRMNIRRAQDLQLTGSRPRRILDLGSGAGWFLFVARYLGHSGIGVDLENPAMFGEMFELFGLKRVVSRIEAFTPLPKLDQRFDLITAFSVCFNGHKSAELWDVPQWEFFLNDIQTNLLADGGSIYLDLNPEADGSFVTPSLREFFLRRGAKIEHSKVWWERVEAGG